MSKSSTEGRADWREVAIVASVVAVVALLLYGPWVATPFGIRDWSGMLLIFQQSDSLWRSFAELNTFFLSDGRLTPIQLFWLALNWEIFGDNTVGWQWMRVLLLVAVAVLAYLVIRRFGMSVSGAAIGASLFLISGAAASMFTMLQVMEPLGTLLTLAATLVALRYDEMRSRLSAALSIAVLLSLAILVKETFLASVPFVTLVALCRRSDRSFGWPRLDRRGVVLVGVVLAVVGLFNILPLLWVRSQAASSTYAGKYGLVAITFSGTSNVVRAMFLPITRVFGVPANVAFLLLISAGIALVIRRTGNLASKWTVVLLAVVLPLTATALYAPWPNFPAYYAHAFLLGPALLVAWAVTALELSGYVWAHRAAWVAWFPVLLYGVLTAGDSVATHRATRAAEVDAARVLATLNDEQVFVAVPDPRRSGALGAALRQYAQALGKNHLPVVQEIACADVADSLRRSAPVVVMLLPDVTCDAVDFVGDPQRTEARMYPVRGLRTLRVRPESMQVAVWKVPRS